MAPISAKQGTGIDDLLDMLLLVYEMEKEKIVADPTRPAIGTVIESNVDPGAGAVATVLVQNGTMHIGDAIGVRDGFYGRVRAMQDWTGSTLQDAPPSTPVKIIGWKVAPAVGDIMEVATDAKQLQKIKATDISKKATEEVATIKKRPEVTEEDGKKILNLIIRADVLGSLEAILGMLDRLEHEDVGVRVVQKGLGNITDTDVASAEADHSLIMGFNVRPTPSAEELAREKNVTIVEHKIIYKLFEDILDRLQELLPSEMILTELGVVEVLANFRKIEKGWIVGGKVKTGKIVPNGQVRLKRGEEYISEGEIVSLQIGRSDAKQVTGGQEFGMTFKGKVKPEIGDIMEVYSQKRKARTLVIEGVSKR